MENRQIFAHRGASGHAIENSIIAFTKARALGATGIEIDIQRSSDNEIFVFHDNELSRLTGIKGFVFDHTAEQLLNMKLGRRFLRMFSSVRIPTFSAFLQWLEKNPMPVNIELKQSFLKDTSALERILPTLQLPAGSHFSSFHDELLQLVKKIRPDIETAIIVTKVFDWHELPYMTHIDAVHAHKKYYKRRYLKAAEAAQMPVRFYSIDGSESFLTKPHPIVVGWITDYPDRLAKHMKNKK